MTRTTSRSPGLADQCQYLKGVGPVRAERLRRLGIETVDDLLTHFPRKYYDRRQLGTVAELRPGEESTFVAQLLSIAQRNPRRRSLITAAVGDETGVVQIVWFNQPYLARHLKPGLQLIVTGEPSYYRGQRQIVNPEFELLSDDLDEDLVHTGRIVPVYGLTSGISQRMLRELIARTLEGYSGLIAENLPRSVVEAEQLPARVDSLRSIHFPEDAAHYKRALYRLKLEELLFMQLAFSLERRRLHATARPVFDVSFDLPKRAVAALPFPLTGGQDAALAEIHADLRRTRGLSRLLQGDVGSGKTVVAGATLLAAAEAGYQSALMVPTEILAVQHVRSLREMFEPVGVSLEMLIGSLKAPEKRRIQAGVADGSTAVVVGTHALIQDEVRFRNLGLVIVDEQHRFGVRQRAALLGHGRMPHMLVMTATPIPRTLALTAYADLDLTVIRDMPPGRGKVKTRIVAPEKRDDMYGFIRREVERDERVYLLYPAIEETEKQDVEAAVSAFDELSGGVFNGVPMGLLHGRLSFDDKERVMSDFAAGRVRVLVATTVVEVGIHVPEATIMVVHHPERFGLSQLHQLRGRIGRGGRDGFCFLVLGSQTSQVARERLEILTRQSDGFRIAEEDLRLRGPGEFFGVRQHGVPGFKLANPLRDKEIVEKARAHVKRLLDRDPVLGSDEASPCRRYLDLAGWSWGPVVG